MDELSRQLPAYEVVELLGRGGMGAVYRAVQRSLKRTVAIKTLPRGLAEDELKFAERFRHEAETLARLNHPCIVHIHDFGETEDGLLYLVMEFVDGTDVRQLIQANGRLSENYALAVTAHVCDALAYAHSRGVVHRDIKPANVLIDQEGNVKVADFGLAKMIDPTFDSGLTMSNVALGTPDFVAPEVLSMGTTVDHRADLYAVGVMLYQMLTGEVPRGLFKLPSQRGVVSDDRWDDIICRAMEADRDERYQSAVEVRQALDAIMTGVVVAETDAPLEMPPSTSQVGPKKRGLVIAGGIATLALVAALIFFLAPDRGNRSTSAVPSEQAKASFEESREPAGSPEVESAGLNESANNWTDVLTGNEWSAPWQFENGTLRATEKNQTRLLGIHRDGSLRVKLRRVADLEPSPHHPTFSLTVRGKRESGGSYQFQIVPQKKISNLLFLPEDPVTGKPGTPESLWENRPVAWVENEAELEFVVKGDRLGLWSGGKEIAAAEDARSPTGSWGAIVSPGIEVLELSLGVPSADETSLPGIPWTDVTAKVREEAASNPKLIVEADGIRRAGDGSPVGIAVTDPSWRNYAIRIRHSADTQISLRSGDHGMVYVLNQKLKTLIHRHNTGATEATILEAGIPHPSGFDINQTHELVATVEDNLFRAWVDGRPAGQIRDNAFVGGVGSVMWVRQSVVHSVEVAPLPESPHRMLREGFWGQIKEVNAERMVEIVEDALELINKNDLSLQPTIEGGKVTALIITQKSGEPLHDLSPVGALTDLKTFFCYAPGVRDLEWLRGLPIENFQLTHAEVEDLDPLRESKVLYLTLGTPDKPPRSYEPLAGMPLRSLNLKDCPLKDLSFFVGMPLNRLVISGTGITDYSALKSFPLVEVQLDLVPERDLPILLSIPTLKKINGRAVEEYQVR